MASSRELPTEHLASVDKDGRRIPLFPALIPGKWRVRRSVVQFILIIVFLLLPWLKWGGTQLFLIDVIEGRFNFFGFQFWAHDGPLVFLVAFSAVMGVVLLTALLGRAWCGWACPQTVFIEGVFRRVEIWIEGDAVARRQLHKGPKDFRWFRLQTFKWGLFIVLAAAITHSFLAYFVGSDRLISMVTSDPRENWTAFLFIVVSTGAVLFDFALFREQFCVLVCPYGRLQSTMLDRHSWAVSYDAKRGEPRRSKEVPEDQQGDCINCYQCVAVCPTGVDIRRGLQLECIHCTACMDACDSIMTKIGKPLGLIRYSTEALLKGQRMRWFRPRIALYIVLIIASVSTIGWNVSSRSQVHLSILRQKGAPYQKVEGQKGQILNLFRIHVKNQTDKAVSYSASLEDNSGSLKLILPINPIVLAPQQDQQIPFFIQAPEKGHPKRVRILFKSESGSDDPLSEEIKILGPNP